MWPQRYQKVRVAQNRHQGEKALLVRPVAYSEVFGGGVVVNVWVSTISHCSALHKPFDWHCEGTLAATPFSLGSPFSKEGK